ncbi:hypothetical protein V1J52_25665 [Streptomyces sp. TRM 70351]|uniref:hypothetical protein n=1 Tax=Streptomyces sp. TRM 70351 TaxID=3116552 RepID=UPI002E7B25C0|nr:hypothetical protein [Streptomyces sp. TRM 70351]MEE1931511.1 hypothetical protein [Streptomyces sp. TRM 70351]
MGAPDDEFCVSVQLTGCDRETAGVVFRSLEDAFPGGTGDTGFDGPAADAGTQRHTVWTLTVDTRSAGTRPARAAAPLAEPVDAGLYGGAAPVRKVRDTLTAAFQAEDHGTVPGEHELETRLRLTPQT